MSAPRTNIEKQKRRHIAPLIGMAVVLIFVAFLFMANLGSVATEGQTPEQTGAQVDGRTGESVPVTATQGTSAPAGAASDTPAVTGVPASD